MIKERGYDSIFYPHATDYGPGSKYNTFMTFDPAQTVPRLSSEGQSLIRERGIHEPLRKDLAYEGGRANWELPRGILKKIDNPEPAGPVKEVVDARNAYEAEKIVENNKIYDAKMKKLAPLQEKMKNKEISPEEYWNMHDELLFGKKGINTPPYYETPPMLSR